jgi:6-pyruvoyl-tetrahydropterin synthase
MFAIEVTATFCAAHALHVPGTGPHSGGQEMLHGHNFHVTATLTCQKLDASQVVADFDVIEQLLGDILAPWNNQNLNAVEPFRSRVNPSAERLAEQIGLQLQAALGELPDQPSVSRGLRVSAVRLTEAPNCTAVWQAS